MIHSTAVIEQGAELGRDVSVGPFAYIAAGAGVGDGCVIGPHVTILRYATLGAGCRVHAGAVIGDLPQDLSFQEGESFVTVGPGCVIREGVTIHRGVKPGTATAIGDGCLLMALSHFGHNVKLGRNVIVANGAMLGGYVEVGDRAFISGNCLLHQFVRIGRLVMFGGGGGASKDVPPFCIVRPLTANVVVGLNVVGMRRAGMPPAERAAVKHAFNLVYRSGLNVTQAVAKVRESFSSGPALEFADFITASHRGICRAGADAEQPENG